MALKTFGARTFAALTFAALTLHGGDVIAPPSGGDSSSSSGGDKVTFGQRHYARQESAEWERTDPTVFDTVLQNEEDEEAIIVAVLAEAVRIYY